MTLQEIIGRPNDAPAVVGITGASGAILAARTVEALLAAGVPVAASASAAARMVWRTEMGESFGAAIERWTDSGMFAHYGEGELAAPIASGTYPTRGMVIAPCSMATAAVANGFADNLIRRAADVTIKERRRLVVMPRESPLSVIHLENLTKLAKLGATVISPEPAFYLGSQSADDVADFAAQRALLALGVIERLPERFIYSG